MTTLCHKSLLWIRFWIQKGWLLCFTLGCYKSLPSGFWFDTRWGMICLRSPYCLSSTSLWVCLKHSWNKSQNGTCRHGLTGHLWETGFGRDFEILGRISVTFLLCACTELWNIDDHYPSTMWELVVSISWVIERFTLLPRVSDPTTPRHQNTGQA